MSKKPYSVLVVDDDPISCEAIETLLTRKGYTVESCSNGDEAVYRVGRTPRKYGLVVLDYRMEGKDGATTARELLTITRDIYILIHSGDTSREALISSWEAGAVKFIEKSRGAQYFLETFDHWAGEFERAILPTLPAHSLDENAERIRSIGLVGRSSSMASIARRILKYREEGIELPALILGENGTGKEGIARALHQHSERKSRAFVALDAGAIPENLAESEFFGHERGAFTGAETRRIGAFQQADRGTLFLDEIGNMSPSTQARLLRALQQKTIRPVGANKEIGVDVRLISATNSDIRAASNDGRFREDLFYRVKGITIQVPPLRERLEDVEPLALHFAAKYNAGTRRPKHLSPGAIRALERHSWPGNVRELEHTVYELLAETYEDRVSAEEASAKVDGGEFRSRTAKGQPLKAYVDRVTRDYVVDLIQSCKSRIEAAERAGMAETTFRDLVKRLGLQDMEPGRRSSSSEGP